MALFRAVAPPPPEFVEAGEPVDDTFARTVAAGSWGTADSADAWAVRNGTAANYSVDGQAGVIVVPANSGHGITLGTTTSLDTEVLFDVMWPTLPVDASFDVPSFGYGLAWLRVSSALTSFYRVGAMVNSDGGLLVRGEVGTPGVTTAKIAPDTILPFTIQPGQWARVRVQAQGANPTTIRAKVWPADDLEPAWQLAVENSAAGPQAAGLAGVRGAANTPLTIKYRNYRRKSTDLVVSTPPGPPTAVTAVPGNAQASVTATEPVEKGGVLDSWRATSSPGAVVATNPSLPVVVSGLTNGTPYTFTMEVHNSVGWSVTSEPSNSVTPTTVTTEPEPGTYAKPDASNTGPRVALTRQLTGAQALAELRAEKYLSGVEITSSLYIDTKLSTQDDWVLEDFRIIGTGDYAFMSQYFSASSVDTRPTLRYGELIGRGVNPASTSASATANISWAVLEHCDLYGSADGAKVWNRSELFACHIHGLWHNGRTLNDGGSHSDGIQVQSGTDIKIRWCNIDALIQYQSPIGYLDKIGTPGNPCLQTGGLNGNIIRQVFHDNWVNNSGSNLINLGTTGWPTPNADGFVIDSQYRRNKFGRVHLNATGGSRSGPNHQTSLGGVRFDASNVYEDDGSPV